MELLVEILVFGAAVPAAVATAICLAARRRPLSNQQLRAAGAFAIAVGFVLAWLVIPWASYTVERAWQWLPRLAMAAAGIGMFADGVPRPVQTGLRVAVAAFAAWALFPDYPALADARIMLLFGTAASIVLAWAVLDRAVDVADPRAIALVLAIWILGTAALVLNCGVMKFAQLAGVAAASAAPVLLLLRRPAALAGAIAPLSVLVPGLVMSGRFETHAAVPAWSYLFVLVVPLAVLANRRWWTPAAVAATLTAVGVGSATVATL